MVRNMENSSNESLFLRVREVARLLNLPLATVYDKCARGELPSTRLGSTILVPVEGIRALERKALGL